jgi:hypothetical protein
MSLAIISGTEGNGRSACTPGSQGRWIRLDHVGQGLPREVVVLISPARRIRNPVRIGRRRKHMRQEQIRIQCNARYQLVELPRRERRRSRVLRKTKNGDHR